MAIYNLDVPFPYLESVYCFMSSSNCRILTCIQISQKVGKVVLYSYLLKNFPQFLVIHTVKEFSIVNVADVFQEFPCFFLFVVEFDSPRVDPH